MNLLILSNQWIIKYIHYVKLFFKNLLVTKLQETLKTFDQLTKRHENEALRKKRLAFVGISLDNVLGQGEATQRLSKESKASSQESDNGERHILYRGYIFVLIVVSNEINIFVYQHHYIIYVTSNYISRICIFFIGLLFRDIKQ